MRTLLRPAALAWAALLAWGWLSSAAAQFNGDFTIRRVRLDRDNFIDWRAYFPPPAWLLESFRRPNVMQASVGSLSGTEFFFSHQIRLETDIGRYATLLYLQNQVELFRAEPIYQEVEMRVGADGLYGSIIGFPTYQKGYGAQGVAIAYGKRTDDTWLRLSQLQQFAVFNERPPQNSQISFDPNPLMNRLEGRVFMDQRWFLQVDLKDEQPARQFTHDVGLEQTYSGAKIDLALAWIAREDLTLGYILSDNGERRAQNSILAGNALPAQQQDLAWGWWEAYGKWRHPRGSVLTLAWNDAHFRNDIRGDNPADAYRFQLYTSQVYALWEWPHSRWFWWDFSLQYGQSSLLELTAGQPSSKDNGTGDKLKLGVGISMVEADRYKFRLNSTWAPDAFSGQKWDGGNVQLLLYF